MPDEAKHCHADKDGERHGEGDGDMAGECEAVGHHAEQVAEQHEHEEREDDREIPAAFLANRILQQIYDKFVRQLDRDLPAPWNNRAAAHAEYQKRGSHDHRNAHEQGGIRKGDIDSADIDRNDSFDDELFERAMSAFCRHDVSLLVSLAFRFLIRALRAVAGRISISAHCAENIQKPRRASQKEKHDHQPRLGLKPIIEQ